MHVNVHGAVVALETKLGIGASTASGASDGDVMTRQGDGSTAWEAAAGGGASWSGSTANGLATYGDASTIVAEANATYDGTNLTLTSGNLIVSSGNGIDFSATGDGTGTATSELFDDYEEGVFTVTSDVASGTLTLNTGIDTLKYTKIGQEVFIHGMVEFSTVTTASGAWYINGLPFTNTNTSVAGGGEKRSWQFATVLDTTSDVDPGSPLGWIEANETRIMMYLSGISAGASMNATYLDTGSKVCISGNYITES